MNTHAQELIVMSDIGTQQLSTIGCSNIITLVGSAMATLTSFLKSDIATIIASVLWLLLYPLYRHWTPTSLTHKEARNRIVYTTSVLALTWFFTTLEYSLRLLEYVDKETNIDFLNVLYIDGIVLLLSVLAAVPMSQYQINFQLELLRSPTSALSEDADEKRIQTQFLPRMLDFEGFPYVDFDLAWRIMLLAWCYWQFVLFFPSGIPSDRLWMIILLQTPSIWAAFTTATACLAAIRQLAAEKASERRNLRAETDVV